MTQKIPRLSFDELQRSLQAALEQRVERLGYLGEFFQCLAHQPEALLAFIMFTDRAKAPLDKRLVEVIALTVATETENRYERNQHEHLALRLGYGKEWVADVEACRPDLGHTLTDVERLVQQLAIGTVRQQPDAPEALERIADALGYELAVAALMVTGRYLAHGAIARALRLEPPVLSIFEHDEPEC